MSSKTNTASELNEILMRLVKEGKVYLGKLEQTMERHKLRKGFGYYPRFLIRFGARFAKAHRLEDGDFVYIIPQKLFDNADYKHHNEADERGSIDEKRELLRIESMGPVKVKLRLYRRIIKGREYWYIQGKLPAGVDVTKLPKERVMEWNGAEN
jgi:hypothetical protein